MSPQTRTARVEAVDEGASAGCQASGSGSAASWLTQTTWTQRTHGHHPPRLTAGMELPRSAGLPAGQGAGRDGRFLVAGPWMTEPSAAKREP